MALFRCFIASCHFIPCDTMTNSIMIPYSFDCIMLYCTVLHCNVIYCTVLHYLVPHTGKWSNKAIKIAADQLVFSTIYTLVFFMSVGCMGGALDKAQHSILEKEILQYEQHVREKYSLSADIGGVDLIEEIRYSSDEISLLSPTIFYSSQFNVITSRMRTA